jgi:hypothetical protein
MNIYIGCIVFYAVRVLSNVSKRLVLGRNSFNHCSAPRAHGGGGEMPDPRRHTTHQASVCRPPGNKQAVLCRLTDQRNGLLQYRYNAHTKKDEMGGKCSTDGTEEE